MLRPHRKGGVSVSLVCANGFDWWMERFPLNRGRWVEPRSKYTCHLGQSTLPSKRQFDLNTILILDRLSVRRRRVRVLKCFRQLQNHFRNIHTEYLHHKVLPPHSRDVRAQSLHPHCLLPINCERLLRKLPQDYFLPLLAWLFESDCRPRS